MAQGPAQTPVTGDFTGSGGELGAGGADNESEGLLAENAVAHRADADADADAGAGAGAGAETAGAENVDTGPAATADEPGVGAGGGAALASQESLRGPLRTGAREEYEFEREIEGRPVGKGNRQSGFFSFLF